MTDKTDEPILSRYEDGSWSLETSFARTLKIKDGFGFERIEDLVKDLFGGVEHRNKADFE